MDLRRKIFIRGHAQRKAESVIRSALGASGVFDGDAELTGEPLFAVVCDSQGTLRRCLGDEMPFKAIRQKRASGLASDVEASLRPIQAGDDAR